MQCNFDLRVLEQCNGSEFDIKENADQDINFERKMRIQIRTSRNVNFEGKNANFRIFLEPNLITKSL